MGCRGGFEDLSGLARASRLARALPPAPGRRNQVHESDAELLELPGGGLLAASVDGLSDEPQLGLLRAPWTLGWAAVVHGLSDLAAVGAAPLGVLLSWDLPAGTEEAWVDQVAAGAAEALRVHGTGSLGGDLNQGATALTCTALGWIADGLPLTRRGARAGDRVLCTGPLGAGHLVGTLRARAEAAGRDHEPGYRPHARLEAGAALRDLARAAIDTSDGLLASLDLLRRWSQAGVRVLHRRELYEPALLEELEAQDLPEWTGAAFGMGEYELLLVLAPADVAEATRRLRDLDLEPREVAVFEAAPGMRLELAGAPRPLEPTALMNLFGDCADVEDYLQRLSALDTRLRSAG